MKTVADTDLQRLEDLIINGQKAIETRFTAIEHSIVEIKADIGEIKADIKEIKQDVKSLEIGQAKLTERVEGMESYWPSAVSFFLPHLPTPPLLTIH